MDTGSVLGKYTAARVEEIINSKEEAGKKANLLKITEKLEDILSAEQMKIYLEYEKELVSFVYDTFQEIYTCGLKDRMPPL